MERKDKDDIEISQSSSTKKETICAVVVTYNRKLLLLKCLEALRKQTRPLDEIYIIDNASTDGTPEILLENKYIPKLPPSDLIEPWKISFLINHLQKPEINSQPSIVVHYVRMHENTGGAGGFYEGVKRGYEKGYDWLWLMDDDVEPLYNGLENMLSYSYISKCINAFKKDIHGEIFPKKIGRINSILGKPAYQKNNFFTDGKNFVSTNQGCFEGMLIHRDIVSKIGFPDKRFFIMGDDIIYGWLASFYTNNIYIKEIILLKNIDKKKNIKSVLGKESDRSSNIRIFYSIRNEFLKIEYFKKNNVLSNLAYFYLIFCLLKMSLGILIYDKREKMKRLGILYKGFFYGLFRNYKKPFNQ